MRSFSSRLLSIWLVLALLLGNLPFLPPAPAAHAAPQPMQRILLVVNGSYSANPFGTYLGEILRAEGLNAYDVVQLSALTAGDLNSHAVTILAETTLTSGQATLFTNHVNGGGRLIAMRPDAQIKGLFGLGTAAGALADGYLKFESHTATSGLTTNFMQIHGTTDRHSLLAGATMIARLYSNKTTSTVYPAVSLSADGRAAAFTYDLARNVAYTRQGNPANANVDTDGDSIIRTVDLFVTGWQGGPWVDRDLIPVPQADEQQRLLARLVQQLQNNSAPLPQLWYFPGTTRTMLILTGDAHANPQNYYDLEMNSINSRNGKITLYITQGGYIATGPGATQANVWRNQGHSVGLHPYGPPENANLNSGYSAENAWFASHFPFPKSRTVRNHRVAWEGWTGAAEVAASYGIAMETSYYHWGAWLQKPDNSWPHGHITGSGQAMKFVKSDGTILPIYQQNTQLVDEHLLTGVGFGFENLGETPAIAVSQAMINASQNGDYAALMTQFHVDYYNFGHPQTWAEGTMDYANSLGIPIWNADQWLNFTETRHDANYTNLQWDSATNTLSFNLSAAATAGVNLTTLLPQTFNSFTLQSVTVDGNAASFTTQAIKGRNTAFVSTTAGNHTFSAVYAAGAPTATPTFTPSATNTPVPPTATATNTPVPSTANRQDWISVAGSCAVGLQGAVFGLAGSGCGGTGTSFDSTQIYSPFILKDVASAAAPCTGIANGGVCYRLWYVGEDAGGTPRIGHAISTDGTTWTRVAGSGTGGSVLSLGTSGQFDSAGVSYFSIIKDGTTFKLWYTGTTNTAGLNDGIGYATSTDGVNWTRVAGPLAGGAVLRASGQANTFDRDEVYVPYVIKDVASAQAPCSGIANGNVCYRMWYEGANTTGGYKFLIGYAVSLDGLNWTRVPGSTAGGEVLSNSASGFDNSSVGIAVVVKEGAFFRMWYEAKDFSDNFTIGHVFSTDGINWARPNPNVPVFTGANDPGTLSPDYVWNHAALKEGTNYRLWFAHTTRPTSQRIGQAQMTPGNALPSLTVSRVGTTYILNFTTANNIPANGSLLLTFDPGIAFSGITPGTVTGFGSVTLEANAAAVTDAAANNVARGALLMRFTNAVASGAKSISFTLNSLPSAASPLHLQTFDDHEVVEYGAVDLFSLGGFTPTPSATPTVGPSPTPSNTPVPPTATFTSTPAPTSTFTPSATPTAALNSITHSSAADFAQSCALLTNSFVSSVGGGAVTLASAQTDDFDGPNLNATLWASGLWAGGAYNPTFAGGQITLPTGGFVRSQNTFTRGVFEATATIGNGAWQHLGFASQDFAGDRYFIFSTFNGDGNLHARVNNSGAEQRVSVGTIPAGSHRYRIEWTALNASNDQLTFFIDGAQVAQLSVTNAGAANLHAYLSNNGAANLVLDNVLVAPAYLTLGAYQSCTLDAGAGNVWQTVSWDAATPTNTTATIEVRTSADGNTWGNWAIATSGAALPTPNRFVQYRLTLSTSDTAVTPSLNAITFNLTAGGPTATPTNTPVPPTATPTNTPVPSTATSTNTPVPPTATPTNTPVPSTATSTNTPVPPTATPTNTPVPPTATPTNTSVPPTATFTSTPTNTPLPDLIFADGFEAGNLTAWSASATNGGNLSVNAAAALVGTQGLRANITSNTAMYVQSESPNAEPRYRARFYFDPNTITMASGNTHNLLYAYATNLSTVATMIEFRNSGGAYQIRGRVIIDAGTYSSTNWFTISDAPHAIEFDWRASSAAGANNGVYTLWIDGVQRANLINLDNDTRFIERIRFGPVAGIDTGTRGVYFLDGFESRRFNYIGLAGVTPTATPTNTPLPPTATPTNTPVPPTATPTNTPIPPTATNTPVPPTATPTNTPIPPTATNTPIGPTATPTNTPVPPTATNTPVPPTATPTNTSVPPTFTPTNTPTAPSGPVTVTVQINQSAADVNEDGTNYSETDSYLWLGSGSSAAGSYAGLNFGGINIPRGATITSARLELASNSSQWIGLNVRIAAENTGNSPLFSSTNRPSQRIVTTQEVLHTSDNLWVANTYYQLDQMAAVVQAVINRADWNSGNRLSIILRGNGNAWARKFFHSFEGNPALAPRLVLVYTVP